MAAPSHSTIRATLYSPIDRKTIEANRQLAESVAPLTPTRRPMAVKP